MGDDREETTFESIQLHQLFRLLLQQLFILSDLLLLLQNAVLVPRVLLFDQKKAVKDKTQREELVEEIKVQAGRCQLVSIVFTNHGQPKIAGHRQGQGE